MENAVTTVLIIFAVVALLRYLLFEAHPPQIIYIETKPPALSERPEGAGCLPLIILWIVIAAVFWAA